MKVALGDHVVVYPTNESGFVVTVDDVKDTYGLRKDKYGFTMFYGSQATPTHLTKHQIIAIALHNFHGCRGAINDCSWKYEFHGYDHDWKAMHHMEMMAMAERLIALLGEDEAFKFAKMLMVI